MVLSALWAGWLQGSRRKEEAAGVTFTSTAPTGCPMTNLGKRQHGAISILWEQVLTNPLPHLPCSHREGGGELGLCCP